jgi:oligoribonuclease (3'-5' exoribonuclease)
MSLLDAKNVSIECPKCKKKHNPTIGSLKENPVVNCGCGNAINVNVRYLVREMTKVEKKVGHLRKEIERTAK